MEVEDFTPWFDTCDTTIAAYQDDDVTIITRFIGPNVIETEVEGGVYDGETAYVPQLERGRGWSSADGGEGFRLRGDIVEKSGTFPAGSTKVRRRHSLR